MAERNFIVFKNKKFYYDYELFKTYCRFFDNRPELPKDLYLVSEFQNLQPPLNNSIVEDFINYCQYGNVHLELENVLQLHHLGQTFKAPGLVRLTNIFIQENKNDILKDFFRSKNEPNAIIEKLIADELINYLDEPRLITFQISTIYRILRLYFKEKPCSRKIIDFIFKTFENYKSDSSVLLTLIEVNDDEEYFLQKLYYLRPADLDLTFVHSSHLVYLLKQKFE